MAKKGIGMKADMMSSVKVGKAEKELAKGSRTLAVVGASTDREKFGYRVYKALKDMGLKPYPVNPHHAEVEGERCYPDLASLPKKPDTVITVTQPGVTETVVRECKRLGIKSVWMQPGSESERAIEFCRKNGMTCVHHACFVMDGLGATRM